MDSRVNVRSVHALEEQRAALITYTYTCRDAMNAAVQEVRRTEAWLAERKRHWEFEVRQREADVRRAQAALHSCEMSGDRDDEGNYHAPDCRNEEWLLAEAQRLLREAQQNLFTVVSAQRAVTQASAEYQAEARRLSNLLNTEVPRGAALLQTKSQQLHAYLTTNLAAGAAGSVLGGIGLAAAAIAEIVGALHDEPEATEAFAPHVDDPDIVVTDDDTLEDRVAQEQQREIARRQAWMEAQAQRDAARQQVVIEPPIPPMSQPLPPMSHRHAETEGGVEREPGPEGIEGDGRSPEQGG